MSRFVANFALSKGKKDINRFYIYYNSRSGYRFISRMFQVWDNDCWLLPATQRFVVLVEFLVRLKIRENTAWGRSDFFPTLFLWQPHVRQIYDKTVKNYYKKKFHSGVSESVLGSVSRLVPPPLHPATSGILIELPGCCCRFATQHNKKSRSIQQEMDCNSC